MFCGPFASRGFQFNKVSQYFSENGAMMDKIVFFVFGGDFLTSRTRLTGRTFLGVGIKKDSTLVVESLGLWALTDSNRRPSACKADALNQLS